MKRRVVEARFSAKRSANGYLTLDAGPAEPEVLLRGVDTDSAQWLEAGSFESVALEWGTDRVQVTLAARGAEHRLEADSAIVHEPRQRLYDALPLATFDSDARRFWNRVFRLMRIPGGRLLLKVLARGTASKRRPA
jgi:hypothetical protein